MSLLRVVVADDDPDLRYLVRAALESSGSFEVVGEAGDGRAAIDAAARDDPDIVLLDLSMPDLDGVQALPLIQRAAPGARVVVLSSFPSERMAPIARSRGAVGYLEKGITPRQLVDELLAVAGVLEVTQAALLEAETSLAGELRSAGEARRFVDETLRRWDCADLLDTVKLLISEMVTNAVVHAGSDVDVCVQLTDRVVRVSVFDDSPQQPVVKRAAAEETSGRGMALVDAMSSDWGVEPTFKGKRVWFELPRPDLRQG